MVCPSLEEHREGCEIEIAYEYSVIKPLVAIIQILYGFSELYEARGMQIDRFGYAAYSFTVIPYMMMSFMNLAASLCRPTYPCVYLVHYGDKLPQRCMDELVPLDLGGDFAEDQPRARGQEAGPKIGHDCPRELEHLVGGAIGCAHRLPTTAAPKPQVSLTANPLTLVSIYMSPPQIYNQLSR